jgi:3-deoxy-7-phosphoheptulonate synthase
VARRRLADLPGPVSWSSVSRLRGALASVAHRQALVVQGGDCAETFGASEDLVRATLDVLDMVGARVGAAAGLPVVRVGRMAGQYAKPRSSEVEQVGDRQLPSFRGHIVHDDAPDPAARRPDPGRLVRAHAESAATLAVIDRWVGERRVDVWTSHEALLLDYEESLVRVDALTGIAYGSSGGLLWLGERTRHPDGPHARLLAGLANPVAVKLGPTTTPQEVQRLCHVLDPWRQPGRLALVARMGAGKVEQVLPGLVAAARSTGHPVTWLCDPMHGNTVVLGSGRKTRYVDVVMGEAVSFVEAVLSADAFPGGLHLELTGDEVEECVAHPGLAPGRSTTLCDPRLNAAQSLQVAEAWATALGRTGSSGVA